VVYLPPTTSLIKPMDQAAITNVKFEIPKAVFMGG
jgi:hypothetical protein